MASSVNPPSVPAQTPVEKPLVPPVNVLPSSIAQTYSYVHPILLLSLGATRFNGLVENPVQELLSDIPWLAGLQLTYVILCLPPAGSTSHSEGPTHDAKAPRTLRSGKPGYRRKHSGKNDWAGVWAKLMVCSHLQIHRLAIP